jgi:hypothetical protein
MKEICKRYLTTAPLYGIIPMMRDLRNKEMYIALDDYKEMYAESCMKRGESLSVNGLKEFIALYQVRIKKSSVSVEAATETDGLVDMENNGVCMNEKWLLVIGLIGITLFALAGMWTQSN